jgi:hypothetical protein
MLASNRKFLILNEYLYYFYKNYVIDRIKDYLKYLDPSPEFLIVFNYISINEFMILPLIIIKINLFFFKVKIFFIMYLLHILCNTPLLFLKF